MLSETLNYHYLSIEIAECRAVIKRIQSLQQDRFNSEEKKKELDVYMNEALQIRKEIIQQINDLLSSIDMSEINQALYGHE